MDAAGTPKKRWFKLPHTYVILCLIVLVATVCTYVVTPGVYERVKDERTGRTLVDPQSYHQVASSPVGAFDVFKSVPQGMVDSAEIIFFIFIVGGAFMVLQKTGAIEGGLNKAIRGLKGREKLLVPATMFLFSIFGATMGMSEEVFVFVPMGVLLARAVGYDSIVAVSMIAIGAATGFSSGIANPFTVGVAQSIAELPLFSGMKFRIVGYVLLYLCAAAYTMRYAHMVKEDPTKSYMYGVEVEGEPEVQSAGEVVFTKRHAAVLLVMFAGLAFMLYGVMAKGYYIMELAAIFFAMGVIGGFVGGLGANQIAKAFVYGCQDIASGALVVGFSRAILVVMEQGQIVDTLINSLAMAVSVLPAGLSAVGMFLVQSVISFFIPSGSGMAATTMPIMSPLADMVGLTRQTAIMAFIYADGFSNNIIPTSGALMALLAVAKVPYEKWFRFFLPIFLMWTAVGAVLCVVAAKIHLGPF